LAAEGLEPHFRRLRGKLTRALGVQLFLVGLVGLAAHRTAHWAAWIVFAVVALFLGAGMVVNVVRGRMLRRFQERLAARPESLVWAHVDTENKKQTLLELWTDDGDSCVIPIPAATFAIAKKLAEDAGAVAVSRTRDERAARIVIFENDVKLKRLQARLASPESPLAHALRPTLEAWIVTWRSARAQAVLAPIEKEVSTCLDELEILFMAAKDLEGLESTEKFRAIKRSIGAKVDIAYEPEANAIVTRLQQIVRQWSG
jgi:hypothetical protein